MDALGRGGGAAETGEGDSNGRGGVLVFGEGEGAERGAEVAASVGARARDALGRFGGELTGGAVSYTHLTLPTILLV